MAEKKKWRKPTGAEPDATSSGDSGGGDVPRPPRVVMTPDPDDEGDDDEIETARSGSAIAVGPATLEGDIEAVRLESERERLAAANALRDWVTAEKPTNEPILKRLESDIRSGRKLNEWGAFSLDDLLRPPAYDHSRHWAARLGNIVTLVRNVLLFAPVGLTW